MKRFFLNLKRERVWQRSYANHPEASRDITDYIVDFYNSQRLHSILGYLPPNVYKRQMAVKQPCWCLKKRDHYSFTWLFMLE